MTYQVLDCWFRIVCMSLLEEQQASDYKNDQTSFLDQKEYSEVRIRTNVRSDIKAT